ncbi:hypothetical protein AVEN_38111-1, partial [Araneus ventricosus]
CGPPAEYLWMALPSRVTSENQAAENSRGRRGGMNDVGLVSQDQKTIWNDATI